MPDSSLRFGDIQPNLLCLKNSRSNKEKNVKLYKTIAVATLIMIGLTNQSVLADEERKSLSISQRILADDEKKSYFIGLWEGIDPDDGASQYRSITRNEDGTFSLIGRATYLGLCGGTDRGVIIGTGIVESGVLKINTTVTCFNGYQSVSVGANYTPDRKNGTLVEVRSIPMRPPIIFHPAGPQPGNQKRAGLRK